MEMKSSVAGMVSARARSATNTAAPLSTPMRWGWRPRSRRRSGRRAGRPRRGWRRRRGRSRRRRPGPAHQANRVTRTNSRARSMTGASTRPTRASSSKHCEMVEDGVQRVALLRQARAAALLAVDEDDQIPHHQPRRLQRLDRLELARPVGDDVVDHHHVLAGGEGALDAPLGAVVLLFAPRVHEGDAAGEAASPPRAAGPRRGCRRSGPRGSGPPPPP